MDVLESTKHTLSKVFSEMKKYPVSFVLFSLPALIIVYLAVFLINYINTVDYNNADLVLSNVYHIMLILVVYIFVDSYVSNFSYSQYRYRLSLRDTFSKSITTYPKFFVNRICMLSILFLPYFLFIAFLLFLSFIQDMNLSEVVLLGMALMIFILLLCAMIFSFYFFLTYSYLPVSVHFSDSNRLLQFSGYRKVVRKKMKSIIIRILILLAILALFNLISLLYDTLAAFISAEIVSLFFQAIGILIAAFIAFFSNTYLFFTYKQLVEFQEKEGKERPEIKTKRRTPSQLSKKK